MGLHVTAADMVAGSGDVTYWAKNETCGDNTSCYEKSEKLHSIFKVNIDDQSNNGTYKCTGNVVLTVTGGTEAIKEGEMSVKIDGLNGTTSPQSDDLYDIVTNSENTKNYPVDITITGDGNKEITAGSSLKNLQATDQSSYLADKTISLSLDASSVTCTLQATAE